MNNITKNQHYVPQFLLRNFGWKANKGIFRINIFDTKNFSIRPNQNISQVFSQNFFYDQDNSIEKFLNEIETPASTLVEQVINGNFKILENENNKSLIMAFISSLLQRTPSALEKANEFINTNLNEGIVRQLLSLNGYDPNEANNGYFEFSQLVSDITLEGVINSMLIQDLNFQIIKNETNLEFCISDHPVFAYNWLYRDLDHPSVTGITARGFQIFLPFSPSITLCLYDSHVYKYGHKNQLITHVYNVNDIEIMNSFQIINSYSIIGFHSITTESHLKHLYEKNKKIQLYKHENTIFDYKETEEGEIRYKTLNFTRQTKLKKMPSFISIKRKAKIYANSFSYRDPELIAQYLAVKDLYE
ncbi:DUF4238 domain-containing protein [Anabaena sp. UHCC 0204]|uniref:DUF4238 domain-containing protein n=1 Tax=Anabaena sp. UHCC 0204 TaxID=2590009 RepID=UPI001446172D|nr:DUF4238 domain-containing protein [Anabaena sp. UHCC 0204]MTJ06174.1 DUF4238 domain-containing protein [Anabaena sp. UHCC 0204]